ncbi:MAG: VUT family protein [Lautropia sp.]|nr:VUT family protein [Lautropia sp.]
MVRLLWILAYVGSVLLANVFLDHFIPLPFFGLLSIGTLFFAAVFTLRDHLHRYGLPTVMVGIGLALVVNVAYGLYFGIESRFLMASFISILVSELADTAAFQHLMHWRWRHRVLASNAVSVPLDSTLFSLLAFGGSMSLFDIGQIIYADIISKYLIAALLAWLPFQAARLNTGGKALEPAA